MKNLREIENVYKIGWWGCGIGGIIGEAFNMVCEICLGEENNPFMGGI